MVKKESVSFSQALQVLPIPLLLTASSLPASQPPPQEQQQQQAATPSLCKGCGFAVPLPLTLTVSTILTVLNFHADNCRASCDIPISELLHADVSSAVSFVHWVVTAHWCRPAVMCGKRLRLTSSMVGLQRTPTW